MYELALKNDFNTFEVDSNEQINKKNIKDFVLTSLYLNNEIDYENKAIFVNYLHLSNKYQIFLTKKKNKYFIFELFSDLCEKSKNILIINESFFCVYVNKKFYYYKSLDYEINQKNIEDFVKQQLDMTLDEILHISNDELDELILSYDKVKINSSLIDINKTKENGLLFFILYLFLIVVVATLYSNYLKMQHKEELEKQRKAYLKKIAKQKDKMKFNSFHNKFIVFYENVKKYDLELNDFKYSNNKYEFGISSTKKEKILTFLDIYKYRLTSSNMNFDNKRYVFYGTIKASK